MCKLHPPLGRPTQPHGNLPAYPSPAQAYCSCPRHTSTSPTTVPGLTLLSHSLFVSGVAFENTNLPILTGHSLGLQCLLRSLTFRTLHELARLTWRLHLSNLTQGTWWHSPDLNPDLTPGTTGCRYCSVLSGALPVSLSICHIGYARGRHYACSSPRIQLTQRWVLFLLRVIQVIWTNYPIKS